MNELYALKHVQFSYKTGYALKHINFSVSTGERIAILGANGSGKSTLLKILGALAFPTEGVITAFGNVINEKYFQNESNEYEFRKHVGYVFQDPDVQLFSSSVLDEVAFAPLQMGLTKQEALIRAKHAMDVMDINHLKDRVPHQLSGGEKKRVAIASVLSYGPQVWLFDEPMAGLDPRSQSRLIDFLYQLNTSDNTVIIATHDLSTLTEIADRVIVLSEKHVVAADDTPKRILSNGKLLTANNLIHEHAHSHDKKSHKHVHRHYTLHTR